MDQVFRSCVTISPKAYLAKSSVLEISLVNNCPLAFTLKNTGTRTFHNVTDVVRINRYASKLLQVRMNDETKNLQLDLTVLNTQVRPREHLRALLTSDVSGLVRDPVSPQ